MSSGNFFAGTVRPLRAHMDALLLFAHTSVEMHHHPCCDLAAAAALISVRLQIGSGAASSSLEECNMSSASVHDCAECLWAAIQQSRRPPEGAGFQGGVAAAAL